MTSLIDTATVLAATTKVKHSSYNYLPTRWVAITMLSLYGLSTLIQAGQAGRYKMWWLFPTVCFCGVIELVGWSGRLWSSYDPLASIPFQIQITCTIIAPTPLLAANFIIFSQIVNCLGVQYSRLMPRLYTIIFTSCDFVSLVAQGVGGGIAATADDTAGTNLGAHIMLGGVSFQIVVILAFSFLSIEYYMNYHSNTPSPRGRHLQGRNSTTQAKRGIFTGKILLMTVALAFSTTLLFVRGIYRTAELSDGWHGKIISNQLLFNILDGVMVVLAMFTMNIAHPGYLLRTPRNSMDKSSENFELMQS